RARSAGPCLGVASSRGTGTSRRRAAGCGCSPPRTRLPWIRARASSGCGTSPRRHGRSEDPWKHAASGPGAGAYHVEDSVGPGGGVARGHGKAPPPAPAGPPRLVSLPRGLRVGVLAHPASVDARLRHISDVLEALGIRPKLFFGPEHGYGGEAQDMVGVSE